MTDEERTTGKNMPPQGAAFGGDYIAGNKVTGDSIGGDQYVISGTQGNVTINNRPGSSSNDWQQSVATLEKELLTKLSDQAAAQMRAAINELAVMMQTPSDTQDRSDAESKISHAETIWETVSGLLKVTPAAAAAFTSLLEIAHHWIK